MEVVGRTRRPARRAARSPLQAASASRTRVGQPQCEEEAKSLIRLARVSRCSHVLRAGSVSGGDARGEAPRPRPASGSSRARPAARSGRRLRPSGAGGVEEDEARPASRAFRLPARRRRSRQRRRRRRAAAARPRAIAAATSAETAPWSSSSSRRDVELALLDLVVVRDDAADGRRRSSPATAVSRAATSPPVHDSAVASVSRRSRQRPSTISSTERSSSANRYRSSSVAQPAGELVGALLRTRLGEQVDVDLEVACADRRLDSVAVAARLGEGPRDRRLAHAEEAQDTTLPAARHARALAGPARSRARGATAAAARRAGRAGRRRARRPTRGRARAPSRRARARLRPPGSVACFVHARCKVGVRPAQALRERARDLPRSAARGRRSTTQRHAGGLGDELDRAVVVGRAEPARDEHQVSREPLREGRPQLVGPVADDRDPLRLEAEPQQPRRRETARSGRCARRGRARCP